MLCEIDHVCFCIGFAYFQLSCGDFFLVEAFRPERHIGVQSCPTSFQTIPELGSHTFFSGLCPTWNC